VPNTIESDHIRQTTTIGCFCSLAEWPSKRSTFRN
jgi:hypothetical protein